MASSLIAMRAIVALGLAACWSSASPRVVTPVFEGISLERSACTKHGLLMPVELDGVRGKFIVDSGAFVNLVYESFAKRAKLATEDNADRVGGGRGVRVMKVLPKSFAVPGIPDIATPRFMMLQHHASPLAREGCGIAGVISPASLTTKDTALLIDFATARMQRVPAREVAKHLDAAGGRRFVAIKNEHEYTPGVLVSFADQKLRMMIDTGACCTWVTTSSAVGRKHLPRSSAAGKIDRLLGTTLSRIARTTIVFGTVERRLDLRLLEPDDGDAKEAGAIGADALATCVVAIGKTQMRGACR